MALVRNERVCRPIKRPRTRSKAPWERRTVRRVTLTVVESHQGRYPVNTQRAQDIWLFVRVDFPDIHPPGVIMPSLFITGSMARQGPHQGAQKSTTTGREFCLTCSKKLFSLMKYASIRFKTTAGALNLRPGYDLFDMDNL